MSGIAGIVHFDGAPVAPGLVEKMTGAMAYRGPDGIGHWVRGNVALGQCMLRTTPESLEETQPLANEDESVVLVMDGRVDNFEELRRELTARGAVLRDRSDAELVLRAYEVWGRDCVAHIDGDFAMVIWNARRQEAFCARDRIGNKPFTYHWNGRTLAFASEVHPVLDLPWVPETLNEGLVAEFLANEWYSLDETFWQGVMRLPQAHRMEVGPGGPRFDEYWTPDLWTAITYDTEDEYVEHYRALFADVVRRMSRSCGPLACEVSGGLDSSAVLAMAEELRRRGRLLAPSIDAYTMTFEGDPEADEIEYARAVGDHLGVRIREVVPTRETLSWYQERARRTRAFPGYPNGVMGLGIRTQAAARGSRGLLVGVGGDEWLSGSRAYYAEELAARRWRSLLRRLMEDRSEAGVCASVWWLLRFGCYPMVPRDVRSLVRRVITRGSTSESGALQWLTPARRRMLRQRQSRYGRDESISTRRAGQREQLAMLPCAFASLARELEDALAADAGIELRRPYMSPDMIQFSFATPERVRLRGTNNRYLHRRAMSGLLPESVVVRKTKAYFSNAFRGHLETMRDLLVRDIPERRSDWVRSDAVADLHAGASQRKEDGMPSWILWTLFACDAFAPTRAAQTL